VFHGIKDGVLSFSGPSVELPVADGEGSQLHGLSEERGEAADKGLNLSIICKLLLQVLHLSEQVGIAILDVTWGFVVAVVAIHDQNSREGLSTENFPCYGGRTCLTKTEETGA